MNEKYIIQSLASRYLKIIGLNRNQHIRNMCLTILNKLEEYPEGKLNRWLGFIQKSLIDMNLTTFEKEVKFTNELTAPIYKNNNTESVENH